MLDLVSIRERPAEAEDHAVPGHWEGHLLTGANDTNIATLVERHSRFTMLVKLARELGDRRRGRRQQIGPLPEELRRSLTWDQGKEIAASQSFTVPSQVSTLCDPRSPWQRGSNENTNGSAQAVLPQSDRPLPRLAGSTHRRRPAAQPRAAESVGLRPQAVGSGRCCDDRLNPPAQSGR